MPIYTYNGATFSEEDVIAKAEEKGLDLDSYINKFGIKKEEDQITEKPGKPKPVAKKDAVATAKSTVSKSEEPSLVSPVNPFGKPKTIDPLGLEKFKKAPAPISVKKPAQDLRNISDYQEKIKEEEEGSFSNYLKNSFDTAVSAATESIYRSPEYAYNYITSDWMIYDVSVIRDKNKGISHDLISYRPRWSWYNVIEVVVTIRRGIK